MPTARLLMTCALLCTFSAPLLSQSEGECTYNPDYDGSGFIGVSDLLHLLSTFGMDFECASSCNCQCEDLDEDGICDAYDPCIGIVDLPGPPVFATPMPSSVTFPCGELPPPPSVVAATDALGQPLAVRFEEYCEGTGCGCSDAIVRVWFVEDCGGQTLSHTQILHPIDDSSPDVCGENVEWFWNLTSSTCADLIPLESMPTPGVIDNCSEGEDLVGAWSESLWPGADQCEPGAVLRRTYTATDCFGNVQSLHLDIEIVAPPEEGCADLASIQYDNREYPVISIEDQCWFQQNLSSITRSNGDIVFNVSPDNFDPASGLPGKIYPVQPGNMLPEVCPLGWKTPAIEDWGALMETVSGPVHLMASDNADALPGAFAIGTNASGFQGLNQPMQVSPSGSQPAGLILFSVDTIGTNACGDALYSSPQMLSQDGTMGAIRCIRSAGQDVAAGCMDQTACNYSSVANIQLPGACDYETCELQCHVEQTIDFDDLEVGMMLGPLEIVNSGYWSGPNSAQILGGSDFSFDLNAEMGVHDVSFAMYLSDNAPFTLFANAPDYTLPLLTFAGDGTWSGGDGSSSSGVYDLNTWFQMQLLVDVEAEIIDIFLNHIPMGSWTMDSAVESISLGHEGEGGFGLVDDWNHCELVYCGSGDLYPPVFEGPELMSDTISCSIAIDYIIEPPEVHDACDGPLEWQFESSDLNFDDCTITETTVFVATDLAGNSTHFTHQLIRVMDSPPSWIQTPPNDMTLPCGLPIPEAEPMEVDLGCGTILTVEAEEQIEPGNCPNTGYSLVRTWHAELCDGSFFIHEQTITVLPDPDCGTTEGPSFAPPSLPDDTITCVVEAVAPQVSAFDSCDGLVDIEFQLSPNEEVCNGWIQWIGTATDSDGNTSILSQNVYVETEPIAFPSPTEYYVNEEGAMSLECDEYEEFLQFVVAPARGFGPWFFVDTECEEVEVNSVLQRIEPLQDSCVYIDRVWFEFTAQRACGVTVVDSSYIDVQIADILPPVVIPLGPDTLYFENGPDEIGITGFDVIEIMACSEDDPGLDDVIITYEDVPLDASGSCAGIGYLRTYSIADCQDNTTQYEQILLMEGALVTDLCYETSDQIPNELRHTTCEAIGADAGAIAQWFDIHGTMDLSLNDVPITPVDCAEGYQVERTLTITDCLGNEKNYTWALTVHSNAPEMGCGELETLTYWGENYDLVELNENCWFAENLISLVDNTGDSIASNTSSGIGSYSFWTGNSFEAPKMCPPGWQMPQTADFFESAAPYPLSGLLEAEAFYETVQSGIGANFLGLNIDQPLWTRTRQGGLQFMLFNPTACENPIIVGTANGWGSFSGPIRCIRDHESLGDIAGCTDPEACNYSLQANIADGTCEYLSCVGCSSLYEEDFAALSSGVSVTENLDVWTTWSGTASDDAFIQSAESYNDSLALEVTDSGESASDVLLNVGANSGQHALSFKIKLSPGAGGYYNLQGTIVPGQIWALESHWSPTEITFEHPASGLNFTASPMLEWNEVKHVIDLDADTMAIYVNDLYAGTTPYTATLGAVNFYASAPETLASHYYIDDIHHCVLDACLGENPPLTGGWVPETIQPDTTVNCGSTYTPATPEYLPGCDEDIEILAAGLILSDDSNFDCPVVNVLVFGWSTTDLNNDFGGGFPGIWDGAFTTVTYIDTLAPEIVLAPSPQKEVILPGACTIDPDSASVDWDIDVGTNPLDYVSVVDSCDPDPTVTLTVEDLIVNMVQIGNALIIADTIFCNYNLNTHNNILAVDTMAASVSASDACGNNASMDFDIVTLYRDTTPPVVLNPPLDTTMTCGSPLPPVPELMAYDPCGGAVLSDFTETLAGDSSSACLPGDDFTLIRTWTFTDCVGNSTGHTQTIVVTVPTACTEDALIFDGDVYDLVPISDQCWFAENLRSTHYRNGDPIASAPTADGIGFQTVFNGVENCAPTCDALEVWGRLYSGETIADARKLCPTGWRVPTDEDFITLEMALGMSPLTAFSMGVRETNDEGLQLKSSPLDLPAWDGNNSSGFAGLPGGYGTSTGTYAGANFFGAWWTASPGDPGLLYRTLTIGSNGVFRGSTPMSDVLSVRCVQED